MHRPAWARRHRVPATISAVVVTLAVAGGAALAAIPDSPGGEIHVCYDPTDAVRDKSGATLRIIDKARNPDDCDEDERELVFNQRGPAGAPGPPGPPGPAGIANLRQVDIDLSEEFGAPLPAGHVDDVWTYDCGAGSHVISGGAYIEEEPNTDHQSETKIDESAAIDERRWRVRIRNVGSVAVHDHATFVCSDPPVEAASEPSSQGSGQGTRGGG